MKACAWLAAVGLPGVAGAGAAEGGGRGGASGDRRAELPARGRPEQVKPRAFASLCALQGPISAVLEGCAVLVACPSAFECLSCTDAVRTPLAGLSKMPSVQAQGVTS